MTVSFTQFGGKDLRTHPIEQLLFKCQYCKTGGQKGVVDLQKLKFAVLLEFNLSRKIIKFNISTQQWTYDYIGYPKKLPILK